MNAGVEPAGDTDLEQIREAVRALCADFPGEYWREKDRHRAYPQEFVTALTQSGFLACLIPEEYGGSGTLEQRGFDVPHLRHIGEFHQTVGGEGVVAWVVAEPFEPAALAFKLWSDPYVGKLVFVRVYTGMIRKGTTLYNPRTRRSERISRLMVMKVNPADVVSIPHDYKNQKGRCAKYEVIAEITTGTPLPHKEVYTDSDLGRGTARSTPAFDKAKAEAELSRKQAVQRRWQEKRGTLKENLQTITRLGGYIPSSYERELDRLLENIKEIQIEIADLEQAIARN